MTDWTEPDHADEEWLPPWEDDPYNVRWWFVGVGPEYKLAFDEDIMVSFGEPDFYAPRPRWVSDRE